LECAGHHEHEQVVRSYRGIKRYQAAQVFPKKRVQAIIKGAEKEISAQMMEPDDGDRSRRLHSRADAAPSETSQAGAS